MSTKKLVVDVRLGEEIMEMSVGEGTQTFKWLASAVALRRGAKNAIVVMGFRNQDGELLNPLDKICEHLVSGNVLNVTAEYSNSLPIDDYGDPSLNEWMQTAYVHSDFGTQWHTEASSWRNKLKEAVIDEVESTNAKDTFVQIGDFSETDLESAFALDWSKIRVPHFRNRAAAANSEEIQKIKATLRAHYSMLCNLFIYYAGYGQVGHRYGMTMEDFAHFLHMTQAIPYEQAAAQHVHVDKYRTKPSVAGGGAGDRSRGRDQRAFELIFNSSVTTAASHPSMSPAAFSDAFVQHPTQLSKGGVPALFPLMSRYEFIESVLNLLVYKAKAARRAKRVAEAEDGDAILSDDEPETGDWGAVGDADSKASAATSSSSAAACGAKAEAKTPSMSTTRRSSQAEAKKRHGSVSVSTAPAAPSAAEVANKAILQQLYEDLDAFLTAPVADYWAHLNATSLLYCSAEADVNHDVKIIVYNQYQIIKQAFLAYSNIDPQRGPSISDSEMMMMIEECSLLDMSNTDHADMFLKIMYTTLTPASVARKAPFGVTWEKILASSQAAATAGHESRRGASRGQSRGAGSAPSAVYGTAAESKNSEPAEELTIPAKLGVEKQQNAKWCMLPQLCFCEFLECILKLSACTIDSRDEIPSKIKLALDFIGELQSYGRK